MPYPLPSEAAEDCDVCGGDLLDGDEPGAVMATETSPSVLVCSERCTQVATSDGGRELLRVRALASQALRNLVDEAEGEFSRDVLELHTHAGGLLHMVATW